MANCKGDETNTCAIPDSVDRFPIHLEKDLVWLTRSTLTSFEIAKNFFLFFPSSKVDGQPHPPHTRAARPRYVSMMPDHEPPRL